MGTADSSNRLMCVSQRQGASWTSWSLVDHEDSGAFSLHPGLILSLQNDPPDGL